MRALLRLAPTRLPKKHTNPQTKCESCGNRRRTTATRTNPYNKEKSIICIDCHADNMTRSRLAKSLESVENQLNNIEALVE